MQRCAQQSLSTASAQDRDWVEQSMAGLTGRLDVPFAQFLLAEDDGTLVGFAGVVGSQVTDVYVQHDRQKQGIGQQLLEALISKRGNVAWWHVLALRPALAFYQKLGFLPQGAAQLPGFVYDAERMTQHFTD